VGLSPAVRADIGARQIHLALLDVLAANESGVRERIDTEFLHDFRVAVRRTRSLLGQIKHVFAPESVAHFASEFSWLGGVTGPPRDLDVLLLRMRHYQEILDDGQLEAVTSFLNQVQQREHQALIAALDSDRYRRLLADWRAFLSAPAHVEPEPVSASQLLADVVGRRAWRLSRRIADSAVTIDGDTSPAQLHAIRVTAKKLRYLVDVTPTFHEAAALRRVLTALKHLQRVLGDFNDAEVQSQRLLEYRQELPLKLAAPRSALATLAEHTGRRRERLRADVFDALLRFAADETWSACRRAFRRTPAVERTS
jgi:CHAD domain-containing protein